MTAAPAHSHCNSVAQVKGEAPFGCETGTAHAYLCPVYKVRPGRVRHSSAG
jgi:hypothetical protein